MGMSNLKQPKIIKFCQKETTYLNKTEKEDNSVVFSFATSIATSNALLLKVCFPSVLKQTYESNLMSSTFFIKEL